MAGLDQSEPGKEEATDPQGTMDSRRPAREAVSRERYNQ